ncbi:hypothetical protein DFH07DRAFT_809394 [Mycena maculata]|uniref:Uncharacterized protein n=1 Tax=Mycena maculata TaxID=230809 RepID=A0AAD7JK50_9AGAR|nr:hypothetical protein DFH07DRAFT_809394 [Mycena maculata]
MTVDLLRALAAGTMGWSRYANTLRITPVTRGETENSQDMDLSDIEMHDLLSSALGSMMNIRITIWEIPGNDPAWERNAICDYLSALPHLDDLQLKITGIVDFSFPQLSHLSKFKIKTHRWWGFVGANATLQPSIVEGISQLIARNCLTSLYLDGPGEWGEIWTRLRTDTGHPRYLTEINTRIVTSDLLEYLASYSGVRKLTLNFPDGGSRNASDRLADIFFETVLPQHAASLMELSCPAGYESRWSFGTHNLDAISRLQKLRALQMSINAGEMTRIASQPGPSSVGMGISVQAVQSDIDLVVASLLRAVAALPALRKLTILAADAESNRDLTGDGITHHAPAVTRAIVAAIQNFISRTPSPAIVNAGYRKYELKPVDLARASGREPDVLLTYQETTNRRR